MNEAFTTIATRGRILVVDDDPHISDLIAMYLEKHGYSAVTAGDGYEATRQLSDDNAFDLAVLDIMMPGPDGLELVRTLRKRGDLPIIMVSARGSDVDKVAALHLGADDYVTKPFSPSELVARIESVLRRSGRVETATPAATLNVGDLVIDSVARVATRGDERLVLTPKEFDLLAVLCRLEGVALAREKLLDLVWGSNFYGVRTVDLHVARLRKKLAGSSIVIETVWGSGYRLKGSRE
ncbi:MAG: response regulator transcription factor [Dehalococcoidia bacterium]